MTSSTDKRVEWVSQIGQDQWVARSVNFKQHGTFVDVGCGHHKAINNTFALEKYFQWRGVAVDINDKWAENWERYRPQTNCYWMDATAANWDTLLCSLPQCIDYLSIDLEPPVLALPVLQAILTTRYAFRCITFEHDYYRQHATRDLSRHVLRRKGYWLDRKGEQDDFWLRKLL